MIYVVNFLKLGPILNLLIGLCCLHIFYCVLFKVWLGYFFLIMEDPRIFKDRSLANLLSQFFQNKSHIQVVLYLQNLKIHITHDTTQACRFLKKSVTILVYHLGIHFLNLWLHFVILALEVVQLTDDQAMTITDLSVNKIDWDWGTYSIFSQSHNNVVKWCARSFLVRIDFLHWVVITPCGSMTVCWIFNGPSSFECFSLHLFLFY